MQLAARAALVGCSLNKQDNIQLPAYSQTTQLHGGLCNHLQFSATAVNFKLPKLQLSFEQHIIRPVLLHHNSNEISCLLYITMDVGTASPPMIAVQITECSSAVTNCNLPVVNIHIWPAAGVSINVLLLL